MKSFVLAVVLIVFIGCIPATFYYWWLMNHLAPAKDMQAIDYALYDTTYHDLVFLGASKVEVNIDPHVIDSITGLNSYLLTIDGMGIVESNMLLRTYLKNHRAPRYLFINVDYKIFNTTEPTYNAADYFPYLNADTSIANMLGAYKSIYRSKFEQRRTQIRRVFATTDAQRMHAMLPKDYERFYGGMKWPYYKGFRAVRLTWNENEQLPLRKQHINEDKKGYNLLVDMIAYAKQKNIKPVLFTTPEEDVADYMIDNYKDVVKKIEKLSDSLNVPFWNYENHFISHDKRYFYNYAHLNYDGAEIISRDLALDINKFLFTNNSHHD